MPIDVDTTGGRGGGGGGGEGGMVAWKSKQRIWSKRNGMARDHLQGSGKQVFRVKKLVGRRWGAPNSNYLLAMGWPGTFVMPFSITLNASHAHIKQTHTCIHRHTQTCTDTPTHIIQTHTHTSHRHTHNMCCVCVCMCVHMAIHKLIHDHTMQWVAQLRALMHSDI